MKNPLLQIPIYGVLCVSFGYLLYWSATFFTRIANVSHWAVPRTATEISLLFCVTISLFLMARFIDKRPLHEYGFVVRRLVPDLFIGFVTGMGFVAVNMGVKYLFDKGAIKHGSSPFLLEVFAFALLVGLVEEIAFRGYVFGVTERRCGSGIALAVSTALFGAAHIFGDGSVTGSEQKMMLGRVGFVITATALGFTLGTIYVATRRLWLVAGVHGGIDFLALIFKSWAVPGLVIVLSVIIGIVLIRYSRKQGRWRHGEHREQLPGTV